MRKEWDSKKLEEVCEMYQPKTISKSKMIPDGKYPVFGANGIIGRYNKFNHEDSELLVTCRGATCGSINISLPKSWINGNAMVIKPKTTNLNRKFLTYFFRGGFDFSEIISGSAQPQITRQSLNPVEVPIPSLAEQREIVILLDKAFVAIDQARANIEKNIENAKELVVSSKNRVYEEIEKSFPIAKLPFVCNEIFAGGDAPKENLSKEVTEEYCIPVIANAVKDNGLYGYTDKARVTEPAVTIAARGSGTGHTEIRKKPFFPIVRLIVLIPDLEKINLKFLKFSVESLTILKSGSAIPQLTVPMIKRYSFPLPGLEKQQHIVAHIMELGKEVDEIICLNQKRLANLEELKKSILQKAFSGELTQKDVKEVAV
jgi:type I restriction enzyme, S subunit